jgi:hypothetical protein
MPRVGGEDVASTADVASFRARVGGYVVDMVIFGAIAMVIVVIAGMVLLLSTDFAEQDPADRDLYSFLGIIGLGTPAVWSLLNIALLSARGQTGGQYVAGVRLARDDGTPLALRDALAWWFCFNPLLFSWPMALVAGFPLAAVVALVLGEFSLFAFLAVVVLCLLMPIVAFVSGLTDARNRALHDRVVGTVARPVD